MASYTHEPATEAAALHYQDKILPLVSRTFALTIPQLPQSLRNVVANAYLLCRVADTIEDDALLTPQQKQHYGKHLTAVISGEEPADPLSCELVPKLSPLTSVAEKDLLAQLPLIIYLTHSFNENQRLSIERCVNVMCYGMGRFQQQVSVDGLAEIGDMNSYCYYVAGVVGELLTDLFCDYSDEIENLRQPMHTLAASFGQGLQMTNILKDQWDDRKHGVCWLPRDVFARRGLSLSELSPGDFTPAYADALNELIGFAHGHLRNALSYTLLIPKHETGIRSFCYWAISLAILTLKNIRNKPGFVDAAEVKVPRSKVAKAILLSNLSVRSNALLAKLFDITAAELPIISPLLDQKGDTPGKNSFFLPGA